MKQDKIWGGVFLGVAMLSMMILTLICCFLLGEGVTGIVQIGVGDFLLGKEWRPTDSPPSFGILPMIMGSIMITGGAVLVGVPFGILTGVFLVYFCPVSCRKWLSPLVEILSGIPSVIYGAFGLMVIVPFVQHHIGGTGRSIVSASLLLGLMILPTMIALCQSAISAVSVDSYKGAMALGVCHSRAVFFAVLPGAKGGMLTAVVLGVGRALGETMAVIMVAGNQPRMTGDITSGIRTLTGNIVMELGYAVGAHRQALIGTGVVLFLMILVINGVVFMQQEKGVTYGKK